MSSSHLEPNLSFDPAIPSGLSSLPSTLLRICLAGIVIIAAVVSVWIPVHAAVTLASFDAEAGDGHVLVKWSTASELNSAGFYVLRGSQQEGEYQRISNFISSTGDQLIGADYEYDDQGLQNGTTYYYRLEAIDTSNNSEFFGPISAVPGVATATPTVTHTPDPSASATITTTPGPSPTPSINATPTLSLTPTQIPSSTPVPSATVTLEATHTSTPSATVTLTATLIPFPTITLIYPSPTATAESTETPLPATQDASGSQSNFLRFGLIVSIALLWVLLGGWLYIFFYRGGPW